MLSKRAQFNNSLAKIISGGQTGVDRAALDAAGKTGLATGGWCPKGCLAEDGTIPPKYMLVSTPSERYNQRTEWNVRDSDGTLIIFCGRTLTGGTAYTFTMIKHYAKPYLLINLDQGNFEMKFHPWLINNRIQVLNIAGPRESTFHGIYQKTYTTLRALFMNMSNLKELP